MRLPSPRRASWSCCVLFLLANGAGAEVVSDRSLGGGSVGKSGGDFSIPAAAGLRKGGNLFHSFSEFNLVAGESATFNDLAGVQNVLARVTGDASSIDGTIRSAANLFLMNPRGILFGPNASLEVAGSFTATTADYLKLSDGVRFNALAAAGEVDSLTAAPVAAFGFLSPAPEPIAVEGSLLTGASGRTVSFIGGDLSFQDALVRAPAGRLELAAVKSAGEIPLGLAGARGRGRVSLTRTKMETDGELGGAVVIRAGALTVDRSRVTSRTTGPGKGAPMDVQVNGQLQVTRRTPSGEVSALLTETTGAGEAGDFSLRGRAVRLEEDSQLGSRATAAAASTARAGRVKVEARRVSITGESASISASTFGEGRGNRVEVRARDVQLRGVATDSAGPTGIFSNTNLAAEDGVGGAGGRVRVQAGTLRIATGGAIRADTSGLGAGGGASVRAGRILIDGSGSRVADTDKTGIFADTLFGGAGARGGDVHVLANRLLITNGGLISTKTLGLGPCGDTTVKVRDLEIRRGSSPLFTGIAVDSPVPVGGPGGTLRVDAASVRVLDGGQISANTAGLGAGGSVFVVADDILLAGRPDLPTGIFAESTATGAGGRGGNVEVTTSDLRIEDGARISANTFGRGAGGDVLVRADLGVIDGGSSGIFTGISAATLSPTQPGPGGNVRVENDDLTLHCGGNIAGSTLGPGAGGRVDVRAETLRLRTAAAIAASSAGRGPGGSVQVRAGRLSLDSLAAIEASATAAGVAGSVAIQVREPLTLGGASSIRTTSALSSSGTVGIISETSILLDGASSITVRAALGDAGLISLQAPDRIILRDSTVIAEAGLNGGNVSIDPQFVILDQSRISANAILGAGGNILVVADTFLASSSAVTASSEASVQGTVEIQSPEADLASALVALSASLISDKVRLQERCAMRLGGDVSSFLVIGRGNTPLSPEEPAVVLSGRAAIAP